MFWFSVFVLAQSISFGQNPFYKGNNLLMPENLLVDYVVPLKPCLQPFIGDCPDSLKVFTVENTSENDLFKNILNSISIYKINLYNPNYDYPIYYIYTKRQLLNINLVKERLGYKISQGLLTDSLGNEKVVSIVQNIDTTELFGMNFFEEWLLTEKPFKMTKKVIGFTPIRKYYRDDDFSLKRPMFNKTFLFIDTIVKKKEIIKSDKRMIHTNTITYEYFLNNHFSLSENTNNQVTTYNSFRKLANENDYDLISLYTPYLNDFGITRFLELIVDKVLKQKYPAYNQNQKIMNIEQIRDNLGIHKDTVQVEVIENTGESRTEKQVVETTFNPRSIKSILFHEEWYLDPVTLRMRKIIKGVSLIRWIYKDNDFEELNPIKKFAFTVYFED